MKVIILQNAYFNDEYLEKNRILELNLKECPSWAKKIKQTRKELEQKRRKTAILNEEEKEEKLNKLLDKAIEKDIILEDADKKTIDEQIKELEELLKKGDE